MEIKPIHNQEQIPYKQDNIMTINSLTTPSEQELHSTQYDRGMSLLTSTYSAPGYTNSYDPEFNRVSHDYGQNNFLTQKEARVNVFHNHRGPQWIRAPRVYSDLRKYALTKHPAPPREGWTAIRQSMLQQETEVEQARQFPVVEPSILRQESEEQAENFPLVSPKHDYFLPSISDWETVQEEIQTFTQLGNTQVTQDRDTAWVENARRKAMSQNS